MKNKILLFFTFLCIGNILFAQVTDNETVLRKNEQDTLKGWKTGGVFSITGAQTSLTNWSAGGENAISVNAFFSVFANYKRGKGAWDNSLDMGYGMMKQGLGNDIPFSKTDDKIDLLSKFGYKAFRNWYYAALFNVKTQMTPGYKLPTDTVKISNFLAPAYIVGAIGMDFKPNNHLSMFIAPFTAKWTIVNDPILSAAGAFGVEPGEIVKSEFGGYIRFIYSKNDFKAPFLKNLSFTTKLDLYSNYLKDPQFIDVNWENLISMKVNKYITVSLIVHLIYDYDIKFISEVSGNPVDKVQFKEIFGVGFAYKF
ncbi:MAG TPA: DUF3078 domain-containing protein [Bacteroidales bacterium]|jgi:hypothetical protein|nr:DUF3078 domain-containing protein [Bacteroidales bacterium]HPS71655.1 DUF3078 domain-containing protein [Bacteroidales bacterium]